MHVYIGYIGLFIELFDISLPYQYVFMNNISIQLQMYLVCIPMLPSLCIPVWVVSDQYYTEMYSITSYIMFNNILILYSKLNILLIYMLTI